MADAISSVAGEIIGWLGSQAAQEIGLLLGVSGALEDLNGTLSMINARLRDAGRVKNGSETVKLWLERLEDLVYEAGILMDELSYEDLRKQVMLRDNNKMMEKVRTFFSSSNQVAFRLKIAHKIENLNKKLEKIIRDKELVHFDVLSQGNEGIYANFPSLERHTHSFVPEVYFWEIYANFPSLERDEEKEEILKRLRDNENGIEAKLSVIPIVGAGGLGKTTLTQLVFNDKKVQEQFDLTMWVCVSDDFDVKLLLRKIINSATQGGKSPDQNLETMEQSQSALHKKINDQNLETMEGLQSSLHKKIYGKRYLLILDDVWNEDVEEWKKLEALLSFGANGSRVILTTRSERVAKITGTIEPYLLGILDDNKSWSLFKKIAFGREEDPKNSEIVKIGKKIVEKCGGVPLAIKAIGRMLFLKNSEIEWLSLVEKELHEIFQNENEDIVFLTLKLSYDHLPSYLKHCFCYCSLFPKDYKINVNILVKHWMAQGYIEMKDQNKCLEEVGKEYFMELLWRSFFQEVEKDEHGDIVSCKMHDLVHDLAMSLVGKKCVTLLDLRKGNTIVKETRHLSFDFNLYSPNEVPTFGIHAKTIRSIFLSHEEYLGDKGKSSKSFCGEIISTFDSLRFLDLHKLGIRTVPNHIRELKYLRYLDLSYNRGIRALPNSIAKLLHLQTLKLNGCYSLKKLPRDIKKLVNLRHLEIDGCYNLTHMPRGIGELTNLQTLSYFVLKPTNSFFPRCSAKLNELATLNLREKLTIKNLRHGMDCKGANFKDKIRIRSLELIWDRDACDDASKAVNHEITLEGFQTLGNLKELTLSHYRGVTLPSWLFSAFSDLVKFELRRCVSCHYIPSLNQLCSLKELILGQMPALEYVMENSDSFVTLALPSLKSLRLEELPNLKSWWRDDALSNSTFPSLSKLEIFRCPELSRMPLYPYVENLWLNDTSVKLLEETVMRDSSASTSTSSTVIPLCPLPNLKTLSLWSIKNLQSLPDFVESLTSLKELSIWGWDELKCLSISSFQNLRSLQRLCISNCKELDLSNFDDAWQSLRSLQTLEFQGIPKLVALPEGLQHLTTLRSLELWRCENLSAIPEWIGNFTSLQTLRIYNCPKLTSLPEAIRTIPCLNTLYISNCSVLLQRCRREIGEDWPKIAHIPHLHLREDQSSGPILHFFKNFESRVPQLCFK